jgi:hypothetical protein
LLDLCRLKIWKQNGIRIQLKSSLNGVKLRARGSAFSIC